MKVCIPVFVLLIGFIAVNSAAYASCASGTFNLASQNSSTDPATNPYDGTTIIIANNVATISAPGTYCIPNTGLTLGTGNNVTDTSKNAQQVGRFVIAVSNVTITGESTSATLTGGAQSGSIFTVNAGLTGVSFTNFTLTESSGSNAAGITGPGLTVQGMTITVSNAGPGLVINGGTQSQVTDNTFNYLAANNAQPAIQLTAGVNNNLIRNTINGNANTNTAAQSGLQVITSMQTTATIQDNQFLNLGGNCIDASAQGFTNSTIQGNTCTNPLLGGFLLGSVTKTTVASNNLTGIGVLGSTSGGTTVTGAKAPCIADTGGSNNQYNSNTCARSASTGNAMDIASSNTQLNSNTITWSSSGGTTANTAGAVGIMAQAGAANIKITTNTINGSGSADAIQINATNADIEGNTISGAGAGGINLASLTANNATIKNNQISNVSSDGISDSSNGNNQILNNQISNSNIGATSNTAGIRLVLAATSNDTVTGNTINGVGTNGDGVRLSAGSTNNKIDNNPISNVSGGAGINVTNASSSNIEINGNTLSQIAHDGILLAGGGGNQIKQNTITNAGTLASTSGAFAAIRITGSAANNVIDGNTIHDTGKGSFCVGISLIGAGSNSNQITNNEVTEANSCTTSQGIALLGGLNNTVSKNNVHNPGNLKDGIVVSAISGATVSKNTVSGMIGRGLLLTGGSGSNALDVQGNTLTNNITAISLEGGAANVTNCNVISGGATGLAVATGINVANFHVNGNSLQTPILVNNAGFGTLDATGNFFNPAPTTTNVFGNVNTSGALTTNSCGGGTAAPGAPTISSVTPNSGAAGQTVNVTITGTNFTGVVCPAGVTFGAGITTASCTVSSATQITASLTISSSAANGSRDISITNTLGTGTLTAGFTVGTSSTGTGTFTVTSVRSVCRNNKATKTISVSNGRGNPAGTVNVTGITAVGSGWTNGITRISPKLPRALRVGSKQTFTLTGACNGTSTTIDLRVNVQLSNGQTLSSQDVPLKQPTVVEARLQGDWLTVRASSAKEEIAQLSVQVLDLNGQMLTEVQAHGNRLVALAHDGMNRPLANGVYFVLITVKRADGTIYTEVKKIAVLR
jgi:parallel beta-helix repeat protein